MIAAADLNVNLKFKENLETSAVVATNNISIGYEVPDTLRNYITIPATNFSASGATYQSSSVSKFVSADNWYIETTFNVAVAGKTFQPVHSTTAGDSGVTPPYLFWPGINCSCDAGALNKSISQITYNISGQQWIETRQDREIVDMWLAQMDLDKLKSFGIVPLAGDGVPDLRHLYGNGYVARSDLVTTAPVLVGSGIAGDLTVPVMGLSSAIQPQNQDDENLGVWQVNNRYGYVSGGLISTAAAAQGAISGVQYWTNTTPTLAGATQLNPALYTSSNYYGVNVTLPSIDGNTEYYSVTGAHNLYLIQVMPITIREYLISNAVAVSAYSRNPYSRAMPTAGQLLTIQTYFNQGYMNEIIKITPAMLAGAFTANTVASVNSTILGVTPIASQLSMYTFDTKKYLTSDSIRMLYYGLNKQQIAAPQSITPTSNSAELQMLSNVRTSLDNYIYIALSSKTENNIATYAQQYKTGNGIGAPNAQNMIASNTYHQISSLTIRYGTDNDIFLGANVPISEALNMTMLTLQNPKLRRYVGAQVNPRVANSLFDSTDSLALWNTNDADYDDYFWHGLPNQTGTPFILLDCSKLNWRPIYENDPVIPNMNYSSSNYKSFVVTVNWAPNPSMFESFNTSTVSSSVDVLFYLINKWVRSLSVSNKRPMTDVPIEFNYVGTDLPQLVQNFFTNVSSSPNVDDEFSLVGGSFFGDIWNGIKKVVGVLPKVVRGVASVGNLLSHTPLGANPLVQGITGVANIASRGLSSVGLGHRKRVGRPRNRSRSHSRGRR